MAADFEIKAQPVQAWALELRGGDNVQFNGRLMADCMTEALQCADFNGCLEPGAVGLTDGCAETLSRHNQSAGCADAGFGIRVKQILTAQPQAGQPGLPGRPSIPANIPGGGRPGAADVDWLPGE